jgi:hypothetical protein
MNNIEHNNLCQSVKSKNNLNLQCQNKPKKNELFCGIHLNCKNILLFKVENTTNSSNIINPINEIQNNTITQDNNLINTILDNQSNDEKEIILTTKSVKDVDDEIFDKDKLYENILNDSYMSIYTIRKSIKKAKLNLLINTKNSKSLLIKALKNIIALERYYLSNQSCLIKIQSIFRKWLVYRKKICNNDTDILTFISKYDIPYKFFYLFNDKVTNKKYGYDIRTLLEIIKSDYPSCPYTFREFTENEKIEIKNYCNKLISNGIKLNLEKIKLSPEEEIDMKIKDIFHKINMLDNYTDHLWFKNLNLHQLIDLYIKSEDIWNYRSNMSIESKKKIIKNGVAFSIPLQIIKMYKSRSKLQHILLDEYNRFITEGVNRDEKKLGAILVLTGLVEVSFEAAQALPHLIQI